MEDTILRKVKENIYNEATKDIEGSKDTKDAIMKYINSLRDSSSLIYLWVKYIFACQYAATVKPLRNGTIEFNRLLNFLKFNPIKSPFFYTVAHPFYGGTDEFGVLLASDKLTMGGYVHTLLVFDQNFPITFYNAFELNLNENDSGPFLTVYGQEQKVCSKEDFLETDFFDFVHSVLQLYYENPVGQHYIPLVQVVSTESQNIDQGNEPPIDEKYEQILFEAVRDRTSCHRASVDIKHIKLFNENFVESFSISELEHEIEEQKNKFVMGPLVYWDETQKKFIVSDDYKTYIGLLQRRQNPIPVIIMGDFPIEMATVIEVGYSELIPGISIGQVEFRKEGELLRQKLMELDVISSIKQKQRDYLKRHGEIWIGINQIQFGLFLNPEYVNGAWANKQNDGHFPFIPWTIGHVLKVGLVQPSNNQPHPFENLNSFIDFYLNVLVRQSQSSYQQEIAVEYCNLLKTTNRPEEIPFLIPEFRYAGRRAKHKYRLDYAILNFTKAKSIGLELSPWSSHKKIEGLKQKTSHDVLEIAKKNREEEVAKMISFFRTHGIQVLEYSDDHLKTIDQIFDDIRMFLD